MTDPIGLLDWCDGHAMLPSDIAERIHASIAATGPDDPKAAEYAADLASYRIRKRLKDSIPADVLAVRRRDTIWGQPSPSPTR